jgi:hypothetical protein
MRPFVRALALASLVGVAAAAPAKDPKLARQRLSAAHEAERRGDADAARGKASEANAQWANAAAAYQDALDASDDVAVSYELAVVEDKLGRDADAYKHLQLVAKADGVKPDLMKKVQAKLDDVSAKIGTVKLAVTPDGAQVSVGGNAVGTTPLPEPLVLAPGTYTISFAAPGYQPKDIELKVLGGSEIERKVPLEPVPVATTTHVIERPEREPEQRPMETTRSYVPLAIGGAATVGFIVTASITGVAAIHHHDAFVDPSTSASERSYAQSRGRLDAHLTDGFLVGAVLAAAVTVGWYYFSWPGATKETPSKVSLAPWVQPDAGGLVAAGSF